jgi:hypothetical protein
VAEDVPRFPARGQSFHEAFGGERQQLGLRVGVDADFRRIVADFCTGRGEL